MSRQIITTTRPDGTRSTYALQPGSAVPMQLESLKPLKPSRIKADRRTYPKYKPGMSTAEYVAEFEARNGCAGAAGFWQALNTAPAVGYVGIDTVEHGDFDLMADDAPGAARAAAAPAPVLPAAPMARPDAAPAARAAPRQPMLPLFARLVIERLQADDTLRQPEQLADLLHAYAATYGEACDDQAAAAAHAHCAERWPGKFAAPAHPAHPCTRPADPRRAIPTIAAPADSTADACAELLRAICSARSGSYYCTPARRIGQHDWVCAVYRDGDRNFTEYLWRRADCGDWWRVSSRWPKYDGNKSDGGMPRTLQALYAAHAADIRAALARPCGPAVAAVAPAGWRWRPDAPVWRGRQPAGAFPAPVGAPGGTRCSDIGAAAAARSGAPGAGAMVGRGWPACTMSTRPAGMAARVRRPGAHQGPPRVATSAHRYGAGRAPPARSRHHCTQTPPPSVATSAHRYGAGRAPPARSRHHCTQTPPPSVATSAQQGRQTQTRL